MKKVLLFLVLVSILYGQQNQDSTYFEKYDVGDHELLLMPTAYTMEKGDSYFEDYELFFINFSHAVSDGTHLSAFSLFPVTTDFLDTFTLGLKQRVYASEKFSGAFWGSFTPKGSGLTLGGVASIGKRAQSVHLAIGGLKDVDSGSEFELLYMAGLRMDISRKFTFLTEYTNLESGFENNFGGLFSIGFRFRGEYISWDIAGIRPLEDTGDLLFIPLVKAVFKF